MHSMVLSVVHHLRPIVFVDDGFRGGGLGGLVFFPTNGAGDITERHGIFLVLRPGEAGTQNSSTQCKQDACPKTSSHGPGVIHATTFDCAPSPCEIQL